MIDCGNLKGALQSNFFKIYKSGTTLKTQILKASCEAELDVCEV